MTVLLLKIGGGGLLVLCGGGIGWVMACRKQALYRQTEAFIRFLRYIREGIHYRALPSAVVLSAAARHPDYACFCTADMTAFSQIRPPELLRAALGSELQAGFALLESSASQTACDTLDHLTELCQQAGQQAREYTGRAMRLYPRLGVCLGLLAAILLA